MRIADLSLLGVTFLCIGLNKRLGLRLLHIMQYPRYCMGYESVIHTDSHSNHKNKLKFALNLLDIYQQFTFMINQK